MSETLSIMKKKFYIVTVSTYPTLPLLLQASVGHFDYIFDSIRVCFPRIYVCDLFGGLFSGLIVPRSSDRSLGQIGYEIVFPFSAAYIC